MKIKLLVVDDAGYVKKLNVERSGFDVHYVDSRSASKFISKNKVDVVLFHLSNRISFTDALKEHLKNKKILFAALSNYVIFPYDAIKKHSNVLVVKGEELLSEFNIHTKAFDKSPFRLKVEEVVKNRKPQNFDSPVFTKRLTHERIRLGLSQVRGMRSEGGVLHSLKQSVKGKTRLLGFSGGESIFKIHDSWLEHAKNFLKKRKLK